MEFVVFKYKFAITAISTIKRIQQRCWHHDPNAIPVVSYIKSLPPINGKRRWVCTNCNKVFD